VLVKVKPIKPMVVRAGDLLKTNHNRTNNQLNRMINRKRIKGIREDKIREEEIRKENIINNAVFVSECKNSSQWIEVTAMQNKVSTNVINIFLEVLKTILSQCKSKRKR
jgi:hypothetical protein